MSKRFLFLIAVAATFSSISGTCVGGQYTGLRLHIDPPIPPPEKRPHTPVREKGHDLSSSKKHDSKNAVKLEVASPIPACAINSQLLPYFSVSKTKGTIIWSAEPDSLKNSSGVPSDGMPREGDIAKFGAKSGKIWFDGGRNIYITIQ